MARLRRICPVGVAQHVIQRGNNKQVCFCCEGDFAVYVNYLYEASLKYGVDIHAWVFMTNHVHLLVTPRKEGSVSLLMQSLGRDYVRYFNNVYQRSGTLWEGRFKSSLVSSSRYLLQCYRYIELNPVRAGMVSDPCDYHWSSYRSNAMGVTSKLITPHSLYIELGSSSASRLLSYRALFQEQLPTELITEIRNAVNKGMALGSDKFKEQIEANLNRRVTSLVAGRRPNNQSKSEQKTK